MGETLGTTKKVLLGGGGGAIYCPIFAYLSLIWNWGESKGCLIKGCLNSTEIPKVGIPKPGTLKTLTSLNKEVRPFLLSDNSIWSSPLFLPLAITAFGGPETILGLATIAFGAFALIVPKYYYRLGKMEFQKSSLLI